MTAVPDPMLPTFIRWFATTSVASLVITLLTITSGGYGGLGFVAAVLGVISLGGALVLLGNPRPAPSFGGTVKWMLNGVPAWARYAWIGVAVLVVAALLVSPTIDSLVGAMGLSMCYSATLIAWARFRDSRAAATPE